MSILLPRGRLGSLDVLGMLRRPPNQGPAVCKEKDKVCSVVTAVDRYTSFSLGPDPLTPEADHWEKATHLLTCFHTTVNQKPVSPCSKSRQCLLSHIWVASELHKVYSVFCPALLKRELFLAMRHPSYSLIINSTASHVGC